MVSRPGDLGSQPKAMIPIGIGHKNILTDLGLYWNIGYMNPLQFGRDNQPFVGTFGETNSESWQTDISMNFVYPLNPRAYKDLSTGGTVTRAGNLLHVENTAGTGYFRTNSRVRYRNGHSLADRFTTVLSAQPSLAKSIVINNGQVIKETILSVSDIDFTTAQIYQESYGYLGFAPVRNEIYQDYGFLAESIQRFHNRSTTTHVSTPYSAFSVKVEEGLITVGLFEEDSGIAIQFTMPPGVQWCRVGSIFAGVLASSLSPSNLFNHHRTRKTGLLAAPHAGAIWRNIATYKSVDTFGGTPNKIITALGSLSYLLFDFATGEGDYTVALARDATPADAFVFTDTNSYTTIQADTSNTDLTVDEKSIIWSQSGYAAAGQGSRPGEFQNQTEDSVRDRLVIDPGNGTLSLCVKCPVGFSFSHSLAWRELF